MNKVGQIVSNNCRTISFSKNTMLHFIVRYFVSICHFTIYCWL